MSEENQKAAAIVAAAGMGTRMGGGISKQRMLLGGKTILAHAVERLCISGLISECVVVVPAGELGLYQSLIKQLWNEDGVPIRCVEGGENRMDSIRRGLEQISEEVGLILIHDGARPFVSLETIHACVAKAAETGAAVAAVPAKDTIKVAAADGVVESTPDRSRLFLVQTPQVFRRDWLEEAHRLAEENQWDATDDSALIERLGHRVHLVKGSYFNLKITTPEDMVLSEAILAAISSEPIATMPIATEPVANHRQKHFQGAEGNRVKIKVGIGYDVHQLVSDRKLILGGVEIPHEVGLLGHSDADVLTHAIMDALLGAACLGDIGRHFPDTDPAYRGISSLHLLEHVVALVREKGYTVGNVDAVIAAQRPKLSPYIAAMKLALQPILGLGDEDLNLKATTTERLGFEGREEGISVTVVCLMEKSNGSAF